ncbi:RNA-binding protein, putative [Bodo saltans]|uniref:RNA-binding protein, putative n=1 Tax=Bodo saltans TaxID=75058 RepID=A0A0S4JTN9_BODSA|nr:RNA-binding protein, putative [Bodo saltans]|eukprot:CUG93598.1 RNA-binding protein, putative [Bodo saltans]
MATSKREVASLLRRCIALHSTTTSATSTCSGGFLTHDTVLTALDMLPSYDTSSITEAIAELVENRLVPKLPPSLRGSTITRRSHRRQLSSGSLGKTPPTGLQQFLLGASPTGGGGGLNVLGSTPMEGAPFGKSVEDIQRAEGSEGANTPSIASTTTTTLSTNVVDSALFSDEEQSILADVLKNGLSGEPQTRAAIQDVLLVLLVDQHSPSFFARQNAAVLFAKLFALGNFFSGKIDESKAGNASTDPFEKLYDVFSGTRSGIVTPDQCVAIAAILCIATKDPSSNNSHHAGAIPTTDGVSLGKLHTDSPYRSMLLDLLCRTQAFHVANAVGRMSDDNYSTDHAASDKDDDDRATTTTTPVALDRLQRQLYAPVWVLHDLLAPLCHQHSDTVPMSVEAKMVAGPPPCAIGATPPMGAGGGSGKDDAPPPPPPYNNPPSPPPSYQLHISQQSSTRGNEESGGSGHGRGGMSDSAGAATSSAVRDHQGHERFQPAPPSLHLQRNTAPPPPPPPSQQAEHNHRDPSHVSLEQHVALQRLVLTAAQREEAKVRTVYINKLDPKITESQLRDFLDRCGQVLRVRLCGELIGRTKYGFVEFNNSDAARVLIAKDREMLAGCAIRCSLAKQPIQDVDTQLDAVIDPKRGLTRACLFGYVRRQGGGGGSPRTAQKDQHQEGLLSISKHRLTALCLTLQTPPMPLAPALVVELS